MFKFLAPKLALLFLGGRPRSRMVSRRHLWISAAKLGGRFRSHSTATVNKRADRI
ncbi:MAG: hypothetical protein ABI353_21285 [Isosphaeraceae bacterium]